jgi:hypothetical protein
LVCDPFSLRTQINHALRQKRKCHEFQPPNHISATHCESADSNKAINSPKKEKADENRMNANGHEPPSSTVPSASLLDAVDRPPLCSDQHPDMFDEFPLCSSPVALRVPFAPLESGSCFSNNQQIRSNSFINPPQCA